MIEMTVMFSVVDVICMCLLSFTCGILVANIIHSIMGGR